MKDYEIRYAKDPVPCLTCGTETPAKELYHPTEIKLNEDGLKEMAKSRKERAEVVRLAREGKIDPYSYYEKLFRARFREKRAERIRSSFSYEISDKCPNCKGLIKTMVSGRVLIPEPVEPTDFDVFRKMPLPEDKILGQLLRLDVAWISADEYNDLLTLQKEARGEGYTEDYKKRQLEQKKDDLKTHMEGSGSTVQWIKQHLLKPLPNLDGFNDQTLKNLEKVEGLEDAFKGEVKKFLEEWKSDVRKEHNKKFSRYLNAVQRLARQNVGVSYP